MEGGQQGKLLARAPTIKSSSKIYQNHCPKISIESSKSCQKEDVHGCFIPSLGFMETFMAALWLMSLRSDGAAFWSEKGDAPRGCGGFDGDNISAVCGEVGSSRCAKNWCLKFLHFEK